MLALGATGTATVAAAAGVGAYGLYHRVLPKDVEIGYALGLGGDPVPMPTDPAGPVHQATFRSQFRPGVDERWAWSAPPGMDPTGLPVVVVLHGWTDNHMFAFDKLGIQHYQARLVTQGHQPFVVASLDGETFYWHKRADGVDWARLVSDGLLGELRRIGADTSRLGLWGWSMGGYGALRLAAEELHHKVKAVGSASTAIYTDWDHCPQVEAFDSPADYAANNLNDKLHRLIDVPIHLACGWNDDYWVMSRWLRDHLQPTPPTLFRPGDHAPNFWRRALQEQLPFIVDRL